MKWNEVDAIANELDKKKDKKFRQKKGASS